MKNDTGFELLIEKLNAFIKKYYTNQLIKGGLLFLALVLGFFISLITLEYFFYFDIPIRVILFYGFLTLSGGIAFQFVLKPILGLMNIKGGNSISYEEAAKLIGKHFPEVSDKVLNTLQLKKNATENVPGAELILASIDQRIEQIKPVPFQMAIDLGQNKKYLKYALIPLLLIALLSFTLPDLLTDGTKRLVNNTTAFEKPQPFKFSLEGNFPLKVQKNDNLKIAVSTNGEVIPNEAFIIVNQTRFKLKKTGKGKFEYELKKIQKNTFIAFESGDVASKKYEISVVPKPTIIGLKANLTFPKYIGQNPTEVENLGDLVLPEGTEVLWQLNTSDVDELSIVFDSTYQAKRVGEGTFQFQKQVLKNQSYKIKAINLKNTKPEEINYLLSIIPDRYPKITAEEMKDTLTNKRIYFSGELSDDYGFTKLMFHYSIGKTSESTPVSINQTVNNQRFYFNWNFSELNLNPGDELTYFFEISDNDGINGPKSSRSKSFTFKLPTKDEIADASEQKGTEVKDKMEEAIEEVKKLQEEVEDLSKKLIEKKRIGWEEKQKLQSLMEQRKNLEEKINEIKSKNLEKNNLQKELNPSNELLEKQKKLEELFEKIMDDEMKKMMEEMEKLMDELDKNKMKENLEDFQLSNEDLEKELDRTLELFKQFEFEQKLEQSIEKLKEMAKEQEELKKETENASKDEQEKLKEKQEELNKKAEKFEKDLEELKEKNEALEKPNKLPDMSPDMEKLMEEMKDAAKSLEEKNKKGASESQENAEQQMQQMQEKMEEMQQSMSMEQQTENLEDMRQLLENLIQLSFDQEALMEKVKTLKRNDPGFVSANQEQKKIKDNAKLIEDSLFALSKRVVEIKSTVNREINAINNNMEKAIDDLIDRQANKAASRQQFVMTSVNNLALLLDEVVQSMQQNLSSMKFGKSSCNKPGQGMPSPGDMKKAQQQLNQQMKEMLEQMKKGKMPNGQKPGGSQGKGGQMSKEIAKMAAEQAALREAVKQLQEEINKEGEGAGGGGNLKKIEELMEQTEEDLVNFNLSRQTLKRQEEILTRLLESEKAEREREYDNKRESNEANELDKQADKIFEEYQKQKQKEIELLKTVPPNLTNYYRSKVTMYLNEL